MEGEIKIEYIRIATIITDMIANAIFVGGIYTNTAGKVRVSHEWTRFYTSYYFLILDGRLLYSPKI